MPRQFRAFKADFLQYIHEHDAWPVEKEVNSFRESDMTHGAYKSLLEGNAQSYEYVIATLVCMLRVSQDPKLGLRRTILLDYLFQKSVTNAEELDAYKVAAYVCESFKDRREKKFFRDAFEHWLDHLIDAFVKTRSPQDHLHFCDEKEVREAIDWMYIEAGRAVGGKRLSRKAARLRAESIVKVDFEDYVAQATLWHVRYPWTVIQVLGDSKDKVGMCINLPVRKDAYEAVKLGRRTSTSCTDNELEFPSRFLIAEGLALAPREECKRSFSDTKALLYAVLCQQAKLSDIPGIGWEHPMYILSFAATKANLRRLKWGGYKLLDAHMFKTGWRLVQRTFDLQNEDQQSLLDLPVLGVWLKLQARLKSL